MSNLPDGCSERDFDERFGGAICNACEEYVDDCSCKKEDDEGDPDRDRDIQRECQDAENAYEKLRDEHTNKVIEIAMNAFWDAAREDKSDRIGERMLSDGLQVMSEDDVDEGCF